MKINILEFAEGARKAKGLTVIIDVFRAFSVGCYAYDAGAAAIIATGTVDEAFVQKAKYRNSVLVGERDERKIEGFDFGNSPTEILMADLKGMTVIHTTTAGTNGLINAEKADIVLTGSLVNAGAVVRYIKSVDPGEVTLVAMGYRGEESAEEDLLCAEIIANRLTDVNDDFSEKISALRDTSGNRFFNRGKYRFLSPVRFFSLYHGRQVRLCIESNKKI